MSEKKQEVDSARQAFEKASVALAEQAGASGRRWQPRHKVSAITRCFDDGERFAVVVGTFERPGDVDLALAYGLAFAEDRDLILVLPRGSELPTLARAAWIAVPLEVWTHDGVNVERARVPARPEVLLRYDDPLETTTHRLGPAAPLVERLVDWADANPALDAAHRGSYLAWHCAGRLVLRIARTAKDGVRVDAGVQYSAPTTGQPVPVHVETTVALTAAAEHRILAAAATAVADRLEGHDLGHAEHRLQAALHAHPRRLGLLERPFLREFPAMRPGSRRAFIDFLGVDGRGRLHVVETKIGNDAMLVLQGLDYWIWASAHASALQARFGVDARSPVIDYVVADTSGKPPVGPYTAAQAEALDGGIPWRFHRVSAWEDGDPDVVTSPSRTVPEAPRYAQPRFAARLQTHLATSTGGVFLADPVDGLVEGAQGAYTKLAAQGLLHRYVGHVRSSQRFALNLFAPLEEAGVAAVLARLGMPVVAADPAVFEYQDALDRLGETTPRRPHRTQVDVLLRGTDASGAAKVALIEVKLSELDFGACSAYQSPANDRRDVCAQDGAFGGDPSACFQLRNHDGPHRRRYADVLEPLPSVVSGAGCSLRGGVNQPMRNVALARVLLQSGDAAEVAYALCAPSAHPTIWRRWTDAKLVLAGQGVPLHDLHAEAVVGLHATAQATQLRGWYGLSAPSPPA